MIGKKLDSTFVTIEKDLLAVLKYLRWLLLWIYSRRKDEYVLLKFTGSDGIRTHDS